jgi:hypothetical protein
VKDWPIANFVMNGKLTVTSIFILLWFFLGNSNNTPDDISAYVGGNVPRVLNRVMGGT